MSNLADRTIGAFIGLAAVWLFVIALRFPVGADIFPKFVLAWMMLLSCVLFGSSFFGKRAQEPAPLTSAIRPFARPLITFFLCVIYTFLVGVIGFFTATVLFGVGTMFYLGVRRPVSIVCSILLVLAFIYLFFIFKLHVPIPHGLLF